MNAIPLVDIGDFFTGNQETQRAIAQQVDEACRNTGFLLIHGHHVPDTVISDYERELASFFALPAEEKAIIAVTRDSNRGYRGKNTTALALSRGEYTPPDMMERFTMGRIDIPDDAYHRARAETQFQPNRWLADRAPMQAAGHRYYAEMERLAKNLMRVFARALNVDIGFFDSYLDKHISHLVTNFYAKPTEATQSGQFRAGAHTDFGSLTILNPVKSPKGLQIQRGEDRWEDVVHVPGSLIINIGDLMALWTNDRWVSTMHRVVPPVENAGDRMSIAFFLQPNEDALISCIPTCTSDTLPSKFEPVTSGAHHAMKSTRSWIGKEALPDSRK